MIFVRVSGKDWKRENRTRDKMPLDGAKVGTYTRWGLNRALISGGCGNNPTSRRVRARVKVGVRVSGQPFSRKARRDRRAILRLRNAITVSFRPRHRPRFIRHFFVFLFRQRQRSTDVAPAANRHLSRRRMVVGCAAVLRNSHSFLPVCRGGVGSDPAPTNQKDTPLFLPGLSGLPASKSIRFIL